MIVTIEWNSHRGCCLIDMQSAGNVGGSVTLQRLASRIWFAVHLYDNHTQETSSRSFSYYQTTLAES